MIFPPAPGHLPAAPAPLDPSPTPSPLAPPEPPAASQVHPIEASLFCVLTGAAGSGKSTMALDYMANYAVDGRAVLTSSTGISAVNLGDATTINTLLGYFDEASLRDKIMSGRVQGILRRYRKSGLRRILLDEMSMISAEVLTLLCMALDEVNSDIEVETGLTVGRDERVGMTLIGDFCQLPPVNAGYCFESGAWERFAPHVHTLTRIWRQEDPSFVEALRAARRGDAAATAAYFGPHAQMTTDDNYAGTTVFATNKEVDRWNQLKHMRLTTKVEVFETRRSGEQKGEWKREIPDLVGIKPGARVMILSNEFEKDRSGLIYANGDLGTFLGTVEEEMEVGGQWQKVRMAAVQLLRGGTVGVPYVMRKNEVPTGALGVKQPRMQTIGTVSFLPLRLAYASSVHKCLLAGTRIVVVGRGLVPIEDVQVNDVVDTGQGNWSRVIAAQPTGLKELVTVRFKSGRELQMSPDHPLLDERGIMVVGVRVGQKVQLGSGWENGEWKQPLPTLVQTPRGSTTVRAPHQMNWDLAYWLGLITGDGSMRDRRDGAVEFHAREPELRQAFMAACRGQFNLTARTYPKSLSLISRAVRNWLLELGVGYVTSEHKVVPESVMRANAYHRSAFLRGLFDTDGCVDNRGYIRYVTTSKVLAQQVQLLLGSLGVLHTTISAQIPTVVYKGVRRQGLRAYTVRIQSKGTAVYAQRVGFRHLGKATKLQAALERGYRESVNNAGSLDEVIEVIRTGLHVPLYDLEVAGADHSFIANGLVVSNTQGLSMDSVQISIAHRFFASPSMLYVGLSRARTLKGLRLVGTPQLIAARCTVDPKVRAWL